MAPSVVGKTQLVQDLVLFRTEENGKHFGHEDSVREWLVDLGRLKEGLCLVR